MRNLRLIVAMLCVVSLGQESRAQITVAGPAVEVLPGGGWRVLQPGNLASTAPSSRTVTGAAGGLSWVDGIGVPGKAGNLPVSATRVTPWAVVGAAIARCMAHPLCSAGTAAASLLWDEYRVRRDPVDGQVKHDAGVEPVSDGTVPRFEFYPGAVPPTGPSEYFTATTKDEVCAWIKARYAAESTAACFIGGGAPFPANVEWSGYLGAAGGFAYVYARGSLAGSEPAPSSCPASIDPLDPQYSISSGSPIGRDGKCPTARYYHQPAPAEAVGQMMAGMQPSNMSNAIQAAKDAVAAGQQIESGPISTSGPASQTGTPTTTNTQNPDGTTSTKTQTPTYNYNYAGDTITYNTTVTTTVVNNSTGATTIETTTNAQEQKDQCTLTPDAAGCAKLGDAGTEKPTWQNKEVLYQVDALGLPAGCPAPRHLGWDKADLVLNYQPACDVAPIVRAGLLALTGIGCILMIMGVVKQ